MLKLETLGAMEAYQLIAPLEASTTRLFELYFNRKLACSCRDSKRIN